LTIGGGQERRKDAACNTLQPFYGASQPVSRMQLMARSAFT